MTRMNGSRTLIGVLTAAAMVALASSAGTAFAASGPERSLGGIHIFDPGSEVTAKFGNPSRILVGGVAPGAFTPGTPASGSGSAPGGSPGAPGSTGGQGGNAGVGLLPGFPGVPTGGGASPGGGSSEFPGAPAAPGAGTPTAALVPLKQPVTLIYDRQNGGSLEFTISPDKRVIQIRETGYTGAYATARGIKLGTSYSNVVRLYGYPEDTLIQGAIINTDYKDTLHCGFQFLDQKLVGIIIVSPD